jgi:transcriptional regulator with XRE-family HTH domain
MKNNYYKNLGMFLRTSRLCNGLSQQKIADHLGVTFQQVQKYETGANKIDLVRLRQYCDMVGMNINEAIAAGNNYSKIDMPFKRNNSLKNIFYKMNILPQNKLNVVRQVVNALAVN